VKTGHFYVAYVAKIHKYFQWLALTPGSSMQHTCDIPAFLARVAGRRRDSCRQGALIAVDAFELRLVRRT
jgi:hypothetical protein